MLGIPVLVHRVLPAAHEHPLMPLDELSLVESQLFRPGHGVDWRSLHLSYLRFIAVRLIGAGFLVRRKELAGAERRALRIGDQCDPDRVPGCGPGSVEWRDDHL